MVPVKPLLGLVGQGRRGGVRAKTLREIRSTVAMKPVVQDECHSGPGQKPGDDHEDDHARDPRCF
jgi:hypothetical protein